MIPRFYLLTACVLQSILTVPHGHQAVLEQTDDPVIYTTQDHGISRRHPGTGFYYVDFDTETVLSEERLYKFKSMKASDTLGVDTYLSGGHGHHGEGLQSYLDCASNEHGGLCSIFKTQLVGGSSGDPIRYGDTVNFYMSHAFPEDPKKTFRTICVEDDQVSVKVDCPDGGADFIVGSVNDVRSEGQMLNTHAKVTLKSVSSGDYLMSGSGEDDPDVFMGTDCNYCKHWYLDSAQVNADEYPQSTIYLYSKPDLQGSLQIVHPDMKDVSEFNQGTHHFQSAIFCQCSRYTLLMQSTSGKQGNVYPGSGMCHAWSGNGQTYSSLVTYPTLVNAPEDFVSKGHLVFGTDPNAEDKGSTRL